ncbi:unnamed protein product [Linum trigynum]|uniref:Cystatin domain-containing protein n=1 Tax=Linum trigynum TaxID=586398 RepID=A0AAV2C7I7_9ROSI
MKPITFLVAITTVAVILSTVRAMPGGWQPIKNTNDERVKMVGQYAVYVYNFKNDYKNPLRLVNVRSGQIQFVNGVNYRLIITVAPTYGLDSEGIVYGTEVSVSPDRNTAGLKYFAPINKGLN